MGAVTQNVAPAAWAALCRQTPDVAWLCISALRGLLPECALYRGVPPANGVTFWAPSAYDEWPLCPVYVDSLLRAMGVQ